MEESVKSTRTGKSAGAKPAQKAGEAQEAGAEPVQKTREVQDAGVKPGQETEAPQSAEIGPKQESAGAQDAGTEPAQKIRKVQDAGMKPGQETEAPQSAGTGSEWERFPESFDGSLQNRFQLPARDWAQYSPLTLAYLGDAVYDLVVRTIAVKRQNMQTQKLHRQVTAQVSARAQSRMAEALLPLLAAEEAAIYRRGRNAKPYTKAKNATMEEYLKATGLEALFGYLYLCGKYERLQELIATGLEALRDPAPRK